MCSMLLFNFVNYVSLLLCLFILIFMYYYFCVYVLLLLRMFFSGCTVSLCRSVYCLSVNVHCTTATGCQPNCSLTSISYHIVCIRCTTVFC